MAFFVCLGILLLFTRLCKPLVERTFWWSQGSVGRIGCYGMFKVIPNLLILRYESERYGPA